MSGTSIDSRHIAELLSLARQKVNEGQPAVALQAVVTALRAHGGEMAVMQALHNARTLYHSGMRTTAATDELSELLAKVALSEVPDMPRSSDGQVGSIYGPSLATADSNIPFDHGNQYTNAHGHGQPSARNTLGNMEFEDHMPSEHDGFIGPIRGGSFRSSQGRVQERGDGISSLSEHGLWGTADMEAREEFASLDTASNWDVDGHHLAREVTAHQTRFLNLGINVSPILAESGRLQVVLDASADGSSFTCPQCRGVVSCLRRDEHFSLWCPAK